MAIEFKADEFEIGSLGLADTTKGSIVPNPTFANTIATPSDSNIISATVNADGTITVTGKTAGTATVNITSDVTYVDSNGSTQTKNLSTSVDVNVDAVVIAPDDVQLTITFGAPQPQTPPTA